jgi:hypothetical protein
VRYEVKMALREGSSSVMGVTAIPQLMIDSPPINVAEPYFRRALEAVCVSIGGPVSLPFPPGRRALSAIIKTCFDLRCFAFGSLAIGSWRDEWDGNRAGV